jgi:hypothetical protein
MGIQGSIATRDKVAHSVLQSHLYYGTGGKGLAIDEGNAL